MANLLTGIRLLLIFPVAWAIAFPEFLSATILLLLIFIAIASDYFDGIVARATGTASASGQLFDHGTDFVFVTSSLAGAAFAGLISPLLPVLIVVAFSQYVLDSYFLFHQKQLRMSFLGRWNGIFYFVPLLCIAASRLGFLAEFQEMSHFGIHLLSQLLIISTIASIIDRSMAPLRK
ncbi:MAG: CDP-alcohol phosphatidyltransferase family protein [Proteobacteria bacterium]|nr:CDP-alcohol phosphatidyltransferase family protein [Pseudomonadota bacterium]